MYYPDLPIYEYRSSKPRSNVLNVGWLSEGYEFSVGSVTESFRQNLLDLCRRPVRLTRGLHFCDFCRKQEKILNSGNGEIRVPGTNGIVYAAPMLIYHYVVDHGYLPPHGFIEAVDSYDFNATTDT